MKIYNYNNSENEFVQESEARVNPLEAGKYLIPAFATEIEPLEIKEGFAICFNEPLNKWEYIEDNRGTLCHEIETKEEFICYYLGAIKENHKVGSYELSAEELEAQAKQLAEQTKTEALSKLTVTTQSGKVFYADTESRVDLNDAIRKAEKENLANTPWKLAEAFEGERVVIVTLEEIREAADLALSAKGSIVGVIQIKEGE